jgi:hypothetical protein
MIISHQTRPTTKLLRIPTTSHKPLQRTILLDRAARRVDSIAAVAFAAEFESARIERVSENVHEACRNPNQAQHTNTSSPRITHLIPQTKLNTHIIRHAIAPHTRPIQRPPHPIPRRIRRTLPELILANTRLRSRRYQPLIISRSIIVNAQKPIPATNLQLVVVQRPAAVLITVPPAAAPSG